MKRRVQYIVLFVFSLVALVAAPWRASASLPARTGPYTPAVLADAAEWPMYGHDYQRTNYNPAETIINAGNVAQLVQRWQNNIGTTSTATSSGPSVANGKVFVGSSIGTGNNFFAFDAVTGGLAWSANLNYQNTCFNVGIGSTAAISGTVLSVGGGDQAFYGLNADTGAQLWRNPMNLGSSAFPWESPLLAYGRSYLGMASRCDNPSVRGEVRTVDMNDGGSPLSQYIVPAGQAGGGVWNSPALSPDGSTLVVATGEDYSGYNGPYNRAIMSLDPLTLAILQYNQQGATGQDLDYGTTPIIFSDSQNRVLVGANHKNGIFYAFLLSNITGGPIWSRSTGTAVGAMPAYDPTLGSGGTLFIIGSSNRIFAVDPATGLDRYPAVTTGAMHGNIAIANGLIFVNNGSSGLRILNESNGSLLRTIVPPNAGSANAGVSVSNGFVYWQAGGYVNAWSLPAGGTSTPTSTPGPPTNTPVPPTATNTSVPPTATNTPLPTGTPTRTSTTSPSNTPTQTFTPLPSSTVTRTATPGPSATATQTPTSVAATATATRTSTSVAATATRTPTSGAATPTNTSQPVSTSTPTLAATSTSVSTVAASATSIPTSTPTACTLTFSDVPVGSTFYVYIRCLACLGIVGGYPDGTFRPNNNVTRGQLAKIVSNSAGFNDPPGAQIFEDVAPGSTFYDYVQRLASRGYMNGYPCGAPGEPCGPGNLPYFRTNNNATRGQISKIVSNAAGFSDPPGAQIFEDVAPGSTFYDYVQRLASRGYMNGYPCGGPGEPCGPGNLPYFRPGSDATRGQTSKIVANTFFPGCQPPARR